MPKIKKITLTELLKDGSARLNFFRLIGAILENATNAYIASFGISSRNIKSVMSSDSHNQYKELILNHLIENNVNRREADFIANQIIDAAKKFITSTPDNILEDSILKLGQTKSLHLISTLIYSYKSKALSLLPPHLHQQCTEAWDQLEERIINENKPSKLAQLASYVRNKHIDLAIGALAISQSSRAFLFNFIKFRNNENDTSYLAMGMGFLVPILCSVYFSKKFTESNDYHFNVIHRMVLQQVDTILMPYYVKNEVENKQDQETLNETVLEATPPKDPANDQVSVTQAASSGKDNSNVSSIDKPPQSVSKQVLNSTAQVLTSKKFETKKYKQSHSQCETKEEKKSEFEYCLLEGQNNNSVYFKYKESDLYDGFKKDFRGQEDTLMEKTRLALSVGRLNGEGRKKRGLTKIGERQKRQLGLGMFGDVRKLRIGADAMPVARFDGEYHEGRRVYEFSRVVPHAT